MNVWPDKSVLGNDESQWPNKAMPYNLSLAGGWVQDVAVTSPTNGDMLVYDTLAEKWTNTPTNVKSLRIRTDSLVFKTSTTGAVTPDFIMLEALKANVTGTVAWACSVPLYDSATGGAVTTTGDTVYLRKANMGALATLAITAAIAAEAVSDKVLIAALVDGTTALTVVLYNPNHGLPTTTGGTVTYTGSGTTISVYEGSTALTITGCTAAGTAITPGAISNIGTTVVTAAAHTSISANNARVTYTLTVTRLNGTSATVIGVQSLYKALQGATGTTGTRGSVTRYVVGSAWSDAAAAAALPSTPPVVGDTVTISSGTFVMTKYWTSGGAWAAPGTVIDGSLIVTNSITSSAINTNNLTINDSLSNPRVVANNLGVLTYGDLFLEDGGDVFGSNGFLRLFDDSVVGTHAGAQAALCSMDYSGGIALLQSATDPMTESFSALSIGPGYARLDVGIYDPVVGAQGAFNVNGGLTVSGTTMLPSDTYVSGVSLQKMLNAKLSLSGGTLTGRLIAPTIATGTSTGSSSVLMDNAQTFSSSFNRYGIRNTIIINDSADLTASTNHYGAYNIVYNELDNAATSSAIAYGSYNSARTSKLGGNNDGYGSLYGAYNLAYNVSYNKTRSRVDAAYGSYNQVSTGPSTLILSATTTLDSTTVTTADASLIVVGAVITNHSGIPAAATVVSVGTTSFVISAAATLAATADTTFTQSTAYIDKAYGVFSDVHPQYAGSTINVGYLFYGKTGTITGTLNKLWGVYISTPVNNYFEGAVQIGGTPVNSSQALGLGVGTVPLDIEGTAVIAGDTVVRGNLISKQASPAATITAATTLTATNLTTRIVVAAPTASINLTLPTGATLATAIAAMSVGEAVDWSVINTGTAAAVLVASTGHTIVGNVTVAATTSAMFRSRLSAASTFITYRIS